MFILMMKAKPQSKAFVRPLRSGTKVNMKLPGPPPEKVPKLSNQIEDLSILKKSIDTSVTNPLEVLKSFQGGTPEVIETMKNECSLIYECKVCRNLFRSIANFITHKRSYCTTKFTQSQETTIDNEMLEHSLIVGSERGTVTTSRKTTRRDILSLLDNFQERKAENSQGLVFTEIPECSTAVYNTTHSNTTSYKDERLSNNNCTVVVGPRGSVVGSTQDGGLTTLCKTCGEHVRDIQTHLSTCNSVLKQCFGCPLCNKFFTTAWAVYRHLKKLHGQNLEQVRKLRNLITKQELPVEHKHRKCVVLSTPASNHNDKGWLEELEKNGVDDLYKCYICGKQFERRVALLSHTQACEKRKTNAGNETKKSPTSPALEKTSSAAIQVRVYYDKKEVSSDKIADCRVVATRLSNMDALTALSLSQSKGQEQEVQDGARQAEDFVHQGVDEFEDTERQDDKVQNTDRQDDEVREDESQDADQGNRVEDDQVVGDKGNAIQDEVDEDIVDHDEDRDHYNKEQDIVQHEDAVQDYASQDLFDCDDMVQDDASHDAQVREDKMEPSSISSNDVDMRDREILVNGFLSSPGESSKAQNCPLRNSLDNPCNGWNQPEEDRNRNNFFSSYLDSSSCNENESSENYRSGENSQSPNEEAMENCEIDSVAINRIICGNIKTDIQGSEDYTVDNDGENDDAITVDSEKPASSVSTELSFEFEAVEQDDENSSDSDSEDLSFPPLDMYVSKGDRVCLICYERMPHTREDWMRHIAEHLNLNRFACTVPSCSAQSFIRSDMINHIRKDHKLDYISSLVRNLGPEDLFSKSNLPFLGYEAFGSDPGIVYKSFFKMLGSHGITFPNNL